MPSLQSLGLPELTPSVLEALRCQGVTTLEHFLTRVEPLQIPDEAGGETFKVLEAILRHIQDVYAPPVSTGVELEAELRHSRYTSTGCESLDGLLRGGLRSSQVYEVTGVSGSGKTQVCLSAVATYIGGAHNGDAVYVDTSNSFSAEHIMRLFQTRFGRAQVRSCPHNLHTTLKTLNPKLLPTPPTAPVNVYELLIRFKDDTRLLHVSTVDDGLSSVEFVPFYGFPNRAPLLRWKTSR
eukprot:3925329-Pyramimonas_sp.AAC.1